MTVGEFLDRWMTHYAKPKVSSKTLERYREMIEDWTDATMFLSLLGRSTSELLATIRQN
jgi:integrase-like protein